MGTAATPAAERNIFGRTWVVRIPLLISAMALIALVFLVVYVFSHLSSPGHEYFAVAIAGLVGVNFLAGAAGELAAVAVGDRAWIVAPKSLTDAKLIKLAVRQLIFAGLELTLVALYLGYELLKHA